MGRRLLLTGSCVAVALIAAACVAPTAPDDQAAARSAVLAQNSLAAAPGFSQSTTGDPDRVICRFQGASGTRTATARICKTAREWEAQRIGARDELERHQRPQGVQ